MNLPPSPSPALEQSFETGGNDLLILGQVIIRKLWLVALIALAVILPAVAYILKTPTVFQSIVGISVEQQEQKVLNIDSINKQDLSQAEILKTIEQSFKKRSLMEQVTTANDLEDNPDLFPDHRTGRSKDQIVDFLLNSSAATLRRGTRLIDVSFSHQNPELARTLAQSIVEQSIKLAFDQAHSAAESASSFLVTEAENLRTKLDKSEHLLLEYRETVGSVALEDRQNIVVEKLRQINNALTQTKAERLKVEADYQQIKDSQKNAVDVLMISSVAESPPVAFLRDIVVRQEGEIVELSDRYTDEHPKMIQAKSRLAQSKRNLIEAAQRVVESFRSNVETITGREQSLARALQDQEKVALELARQSIQYNVLTRDLESDRALYQAVLTRLKEMKLTMGIQAVAYRIVEPATPAVVIRPLKFKVLTMAAMGGVLLGVCLILVLHWLDSSVQTVDDAERLLQIPVLGAVPKGRFSFRRGPKLPVLTQAGSGSAEAFRSLRANLLLLGKAREKTVFAISSASPGEGKTFTCSNLAISFAQQDLRTLLIDADLRRPSVEPVFFPSTRDHPGLADYLNGQTKLEPLIRQTDIPNLFCLTAGARAARPSEMLGHARFAELIQEVTPLFDRIVIDTAPINLVSDTLILARHVHFICLVVRSGKTPLKVILRALEQLRRIGAPVSGTIINQLPAGSGLGNYYHYSSGKRYGREGVYNAGAA